jgi:diacylglycerol O-acyltransferase
MLRWVTDEHFELAYHLRREVLTPLGGAEAGINDVLEFARKSSAKGFDRDRPLWEFTLLEGLAKGQAALVMKVHHVLTDGVGSVQLAAYLFDFEAPTSKAKRAKSTHPAGRPTRSASTHIGALGLFGDAVSHDLEAAATLVRRNAPAAMPNLLHALAHPQQTAADTIDLARSVGRTVALARSAMSPIMTKRDVHSRFDVIDVPLAKMSAATHSVGTSLNDGFLAGITGGMRRYHAWHGAEVDELRVAMPISLRAEDHQPGGNHVTVMRFKVSVGTADPAERLRLLHAKAKEVRAERSLAYTEAVAGALNLLPKQVIATMLKRVDFLASNVPGVPVQMYLGGVKVMRFYPFGPTAGSAVNITLMSYRGRCYIGANIDTTAIPDHKVFMRCLKAGFAEVLALAP